jgi:Protein of unknown function (DUF2442)
MRYKVVSVEVMKYPVVTLTFADGFTGDVDFSHDIDNFELCQPLKNPVYFATVAVRPGGSSIGWNLDDIGNEIDYAADTMRADAEVAAVRKMADEYHRTKLAS